MKRVHLGCADKIMPGYVNCDSRSLPGVDKVFDMETFPWPFDSGTVGYILTMETLEHLSWRVQEKVFAEIYRILDVGGRISIQVPDIGQMCMDYVNGTICDCVPHKAADDGFKAKADCPKCAGLARVNPTRWVMAFCGAQKHPWDVHKTMFTKEYIEELTAKSGLKVVKYDAHPYKIKVLIEKK